MAIRMGSVGLGLETNWRFEFVPPGSSAQPTPDAVYVDVGSMLGPGVLDQHQDREEALSSSELVLRYPGYVCDHLLDPWLRLAREGRVADKTVWSPCIVTHSEPDFDALVAAHLVRRLVEDGEPPAYASALASYANLVDQGRYRLDSDRKASWTHAIHLGYLVIQCEEGRPNRDKMELGLRLLDVSLAAMVEANDGRPPSTAIDFYPGAEGVRGGAGKWRDDPGFAGVATILDMDRDRFAQDLAQAEQKLLSLPATDGTGGIEALGLVLSAPAQSRLFKYWCYEAGFACYLRPHATAWGRGAPATANGRDHYPRATVAVNPHWSEEGTGRRPDLRGLGYALERAELEHREGQEDGDQRIKVPRFGGGYCDNADPWYDGRHHGYGIVDSPSGGSGPRGTELLWGHIKDVVASGFWKVPLRGAVVALIEPRTEAPPSGGDAPNRPARLSDTLDDWYEHSVDTALTPESGFEPPRGFMKQPDRHYVRRFPAHTAEPLCVLQIRAEDEEGVYLEDLLEWLRGWRAAHPRASICAWLRLGTHFSAPAYAESQLREIGDGSLIRMGVAAGDDFVLYNSRAIVLTSHRSAPEPDQVELWREVLTYATFLSQTLNCFSSRIADAIDQRGRIRSASAIRSRFLQFQVRYFQYDVARDAPQREIFRQVSKLLDLNAHYGEVRSELDRLEQAADRESSSRLEWLLFAIGLFSVAEAGFGVPIGEDWDAWTASGWGATTLVLMLAGFVAFAWLKRLSSQHAELDGRVDAVSEARTEGARTDTDESA